MACRHYLAAAPDQAFASESRARLWGSRSKQDNNKDGYGGGDGDIDSDGNGDGNVTPTSASGHSGLSALTGLKTANSEERQRPDGMQQGLRGMSRESSERRLVESDDPTSAARGRLITKRQRFKSVVRLDQDGETLRRFRCDAVDDELEIL